jgi:hypothetical protein
MVQVVRFDHQVGQRELDLVQPQRIRFARGGQLQPGTEVQQDRGGLADHLAAVHQERAGEGRPPHRGVVQVMHHGRQSGAIVLAAARDVHVGAPAVSSASRTNSPRPWIPGQ